jgi:hypothetical protein
MNSTDNVNRGLMQIDAGGRVSLNNAKFIQAAGDLVVNGQLDSLGAVTISGGTVSGGGRIYGAVHIAPVAGTGDGQPTLSISPGTTPDGLGSVGTLTYASVSALALTEGTQLIAELAPDGTSDMLRLALNGNVDLTLEAGSSLNLLALAPLPVGARYVVATYDGVLTGSFSNVSPGYDVSYATPHQIVVTVVPEPGGALTTLALATLCFARRRR